MKTSKTFSTISWNSREFLLSNLTDLIDKRKINFYCAIFHQPEEDEKKAHWHIFIEPNGLIDTDSFRDIFSEIDTTDNKGVIMPLPCRKSHWVDWYLYSLHNPAYLASKGQIRSIIYSDENLIYSDETYFRQLKDEIDFSRLTRGARVVTALQNEMTALDAVQSGIISLQEVSNYVRLGEYMSRGVGRNGRSTHDINTDSE